MNQTEMILHHLQTKKSITQLEAMECYGIARLASRINDLRTLGLPVRKVMEKGKNRFGKTTSYARYYLKEDRNA